MEHLPKIEIVRGSRTFKDPESGRMRAEHYHYVVIDGKRLSAEESREMLDRAYAKAGQRA